MDVDDMRGIGQCEADYERKLERSHLAWRSVEALMAKGHHDGRCEECDAQMHAENCVEHRYGWRCFACDDTA